MLLIYSHHITPRLSYTLQFIFNEVWKYPFEITNRKEDFEAYEGPRIYFGKAASYTCIHIETHGLLFVTGVQFQEIGAFTPFHSKAIAPTLVLFHDLLYFDI